MNAKFNLMGRTGVLEALRRDYVLLGSYAKVGSLWGISGALVWRMLNKGYWPKTKRIKIIIEDHARQLGIEIKTSKRNRIEIDPGIDKETLKKIRGLTTAERTKILTDYLK